MNIIDALRSRPGTVVIVDDDFAPPDVSTLDETSLSRLYDYLDSSTVAQCEMCKLLNLEARASVEDIVNAVEGGASALWQQYDAGSPSSDHLEPVFRDIKYQRDAKLKKLNVIAEFCRSILEVEPKTFSSLRDAAQDLGGCLMAFVDFRLGSGSQEEVVAGHHAFADSYKSRFSTEEENLPKIIFLISSNLPRREHLQAFRDTIGVRSEFFVPIRKGTLSLELLKNHIDDWKDRYDDACRLDRHLHEMVSAIRHSAETLVQTVDRLELHDLAILEFARLAAERDSLQSYLTWILSESLASKLRRSLSLLPGTLPNKTGQVLLDGKLMPQSVLFELFSEIACLPAVHVDGRPVFGDIFAVGSETSGLPNALLAVVTPACDLIRAEPEDDVLCVRGRIVGKMESAEGFLGHNALFGKGHHVVRLSRENEAYYCHIQWAISKGLCSVSMGSLMSEKYVKIATLSELFAQEVKELALSSASRIGIPVDPVFAVAGSVTVRLSFRSPDRSMLDLERTFEGSGYGAIVTKGRVDPKGGPQPILVFTRQFVGWIRGEFMRDLDASMSRNPPEKLNVVRHKLMERTDWSVPLKENNLRGTDGDIVFLCELATTETRCGQDKLEIIVRCEDI